MSTLPLTRIIQHLRRVADPHESAAVSDADLLERFLRRRDEAAFELLVRRHERLVWGVCGRVLRRPQDAEDAFQATFLAFLRHAHSIKTRASLAGWLYRVAHRIALRASDGVVRRGRREATGVDLGAVPAADDPASDAAWSDIAPVIDEEVNRLAEKYRLPVVLCYLEGKTYAEAARELGCPKGTVSIRLTRARKLLRARLAGRGLAGAGLVLAAALPANAVPAPLITTTLKAVFLVASGKVTLAGATSARVVALAEGASASLSPAKAALAVAFALGLILTGTGLLAHQAAPQEPIAETPKPPSRNAGPAKPPAEAHLDRYGDPLPPGAVFRLGTLGFRAPNLIGIGFRKTGEMVALGEDSALHVWSADGSPKATTTLLTGKKQSGWRRALSADARFAAGFLDNERKLVVWDVSGDKPAEYLSRQIQDLGRLTFSANGEWLAVNDTGRDKKENLLLCHLPTKEWSAFALGGSYFESLSFTADGKELAVATDRDMVVIDTAQKKELRRVVIPREHPRFAALSPDGKTLATLPTKWMLGPDQVVRLFSLETGREVKAFTLSSGSARWVGFSPDGKSVWAGGPHGLSEWDPAAEKPVRQIAGPASYPVAFSPDGRRLASHSESAVLLWDAKHSKIIRPDLLEGGHTAAIMGVTVSPDGKVIATNDIDGEIRLWDAGAGRPLGRARSSWGGGPRLAFLPDSQSFLAVADDYVTPVLFDAATGKKLRRFVVPPDVARTETTAELRLSADGKTLTTLAHPISARQKSYIVRWDTRTGKVIDHTETARGERDELFGPSYSPDGKWEVKFGAVGRVGEKESIRVVPANETGMLGPQFTADSRLMSVARVPWIPSGEDRNRGSLVIYDLNGRAPLEELPTGRPFRHAFAPGGRHVAVFSTDEIALWDLPSGKKVWSVPSEHGNVIRAGAIAFTPDGRRLITGHDCTALVWDLTKARRGSDKSPAKLSVDELASLWDTLAGGDAVKAYRAEWELADQPAAAVALIRDRLKPAKAAELATVRSLVAKLDAEEFAEREEATKELQHLGYAAVPALRQALRGELSAEQKKRVQDVLAAAAAPAILSGDSLREVRAITVLERAATLQARKLLADLAGGNPEARLTREAKAALERLGARPSATP